jgi:hypothetical protein
MKHRRVVGGPKKKNRIQEVNASTTEDGATSPLESPVVGDMDDQAKGSAVQRFLQQRRVQRIEQEQHNHNDDDYDEPDNDSGDEGLTRRKQFFLEGGTMLPTTPLPPPPPPPVARTNAVAATTTTAPTTPKATTTATAATATTTTPATAVRSNTTTTSTGRTGTNYHTIDSSPAYTKSLDATQSTYPTATTTTGAGALPPLSSALLSSRSTLAEESLSPTGPTSTTSPHHRPRVPSVSFSLQTTDLESGQPLLLSSSSWDQQQQQQQQQQNPQSSRGLLLLGGGDATETSPLLPPLLPSGSESSFAFSSTTTAFTDEEEDDDDVEVAMNGSFHSEGDSTVGSDDDGGGGRADKEETTTAADNQTTFTGSIIEQFFEEGTQAVYSAVTEVTTEAWEQYDESCHYDWREFWKGGGFLKCIRWVATGQTSPDTYKQSDDEVQETLNGLARMLSLLREYHERFGMPEVGGFKDQEYIIREVTKVCRRRRGVCVCVFNYCGEDSFLSQMYNTSHLFLLISLVYLLCLCTGSLFRRFTHLGLGTSHEACGRRTDWKTGCRPLYATPTGLYLCTQ